MAEQEKRIYIGHGKKVKTYDLVNFSVCLSDIPTGPDTPIFEYKGKNYVKLVIGAKRETDQYGKTHSVWIDTFKPEKRQDGENAQPRRSSEEAPADDISPDDIPF